MLIALMVLSEGHILFKGLKNENSQTSQKQPYVILRGDFPRIRVMGTGQKV